MKKRIMIHASSTIVLSDGFRSLFTLNFAHAIQFNFRPESGMPQEAIDGLEADGRLRSDLLRDDIVANLSISYKPLSHGVLVSTLSEKITVTYSQFRTVLEQDGLSDLDGEAVASLQPIPHFDLLMNRTSNNPHNQSSPTPYLNNNDKDNNSFGLRESMLKPLGFWRGTIRDWMPP
ncbi:MAG: hypothetical protein E3K36_11680 [Candidatus Brocadia sp.]|nr:hypothetical protein [Candidatus Brocadia sp.]